jgi:PAS domain S-box-containing protein
LKPKSTSERRLENALEGLHKVGPDGIILWANKAELDMLGYHEDEYIGHHVADFHVDHDVIEKVLQQLLKGESIYNQPAMLRCKDGTVKHVLIHSNAYFERGRFRYSRCFTRDMTEIRSADRDRAMLAAIIESSQDAIISKTLDGIIRSWNAGAERIFGYTAKEAVGQSITLIIPPERHHEEAQIQARLKRGESIDHYETVRMAKDGRLLDISITISPMRNAAGNLIGASKIARDISDRKQSEAALRESEERFRRLVELLPVGVYTCDASGAVTYSNGQAETLWGRSPILNDSVERFCGSFKLYALSGEHVPHDQCPMAVALKEGTRFRNREVEIERPDGSRITALVNIDPIHDRDGKVVGAINVFHDISALKEAEQKLRAEDKRKDEFLATLAHELRNPLAPIRNGLQILRMSGQSSGAAGHVHEMMERQVLHMVRLVDDLLELSRISRGKIDLKLESVALGDVINHAVETARPFIDASQHSFELTLPSDQLIVEGDSVRLSQVVANLLNNAAKYTNKGGRIKLALFAAGREAVIAVLDNGIGIPRDMLSRVFDMFAQVENPLRRSQDGLGIGLSLVKSLVQMHGGSVEARSEGLGMGTEVLVRLPLARKPKELSAEPGLSRSSINPGSSVQRILCVDDNRDSADSLGTMLKFLGADVRVVYDGPSALEAIKICRPSIALLDIGMPGMDGLEVAQKIRDDTANKDMLLIALTGWGNEDDRQRSREAGFDHHLVKPVDLNALQALLRSHGN